jgi:hypothetical protein
MAQQTAMTKMIEWAISLKDKEQQCTDWIVIKSKAEELLAMEKEQILNACQHFADYPFDEDDVKQYYTETYNK